jgi:hypothetical protein
MKTWCQYSLATILFFSAGLVYAQDLKRLETEVQNQIQVTQDLSALVNRAIEQDQAEAVLKHHDYWLKKRALVARVSSGLAEYETYLATHMDPLKPLYARHNFITNSDQYTADQKKILIEDVMAELREIVEKKIQPEKKKAYTKLLSALSPYLPIVDSFDKRNAILLTFVRAGSPEKVISEHLGLKAVTQLALLELAPGCYSKACFKLYQSDIVSLTLDFLNRIPSHVIINIGDHSDDEKYHDKYHLNAPGKRAPIDYPKHVLPTFKVLDKDIGHLSTLSNFDFSGLHKDLPYSLGEEEYTKNKATLEETLNSNLKQMDKNMNRSLTSEVILKTVPVSNYRYDKGAISEKSISDAILSMCKVSTVPGGEFCLNTKENILLFSQENPKTLPLLMIRSWANLDFIEKLHQKTMRIVYKMKWPKENSEVIGDRK